MEKLFCRTNLGYNQPVRLRTIRKTAARRTLKSTKTVISPGELLVELRHLRYFIKAAELLNFTKAAESLYVSQPTLSVQIHQLEEELGSELFARVGRNVRLTESGRVFLRRALQTVKELEEGQKEIDALKGLLRGRLSIASLPLYGSRLLTNWACQFNLQYPEVFLVMKAGTSEDIEAGLLNGSIDIALSFTPNHPDLNFKTLFQDEIVVAVSREHALARKKALQLSDLQSLPVALPSERIAATRLLGQYFEEHGIKAEICMSFDDGHALLECVKKGKLATFLPRLTVRDYAEISLYELPSSRMQVEIAALWTSLTPASRAFLELISEKVKAH